MVRFDGSTIQLLLAMGALLTCCQPAPAQTVVVHDTFDVGAATWEDDGDDPLDVEWSAGFVVDGDEGLGDGGALDAMGSDAWALLDEPVVLEELGDFVRLAFDFRFSGDVGAGGDASNGNFLFRAGLTDVPLDKTGYIIRIGTGGDGQTPGDLGNGIGLRQNDSRAGPYVDGTGVPVQNDTFSISDNDPHSASLTITMIRGETTEDDLPTGELPGVRLDGVVDDVSVSGEFLFGAGGILDMVELDHIYFDDRGPDLIIDNVKVEVGTVSLIPGDFDGNGQLQAMDIDLLSAEMRAGGTTALFDLNGDGNVDAEDHRAWVQEIKQTWFGDANLDGEFNSGDFVEVFQIGEYEDGAVMNSTWSDGDWNGDGEFNSGDFVRAFQDGGFEQGPKGAVAAVPEPASLALLAIALLCLATRAR